MGYLGTPIDTRNTFQSLVGKRFNGDGSTTAFTLDVAPSSTLDIEVFVANVRQDPNSAYTLSGTTLSFSAAPASGTNNIYVVHQAKSVGTIDVPDDIISGKTLVTLDNSADHVLIEDATDGELKKALIPAASFAGIDDQTSSNDDQLTITDTAVVINEDSDDVDFRVEGNGVASLLHVNAGDDRVGIGGDPDLGTAGGLHIKIADSGASVNSVADELVIEGSGSVGMTFASGNTSSGNIFFADNGGNEQGAIQYDHNANTMKFRVDNSDRMRIAENATYGKCMIEIGQSFVGGDGVNEGVLSIVADVGDGQQGIAIRNANTHNSGGAHKFVHFENSSSGDAGEISHTASTTVNYSTSSDYRLKENESLISNGITRLKQLKPYRFNWKAEPDKTVDGFFAHEVQGIVDEAITGTKDAMQTKENCVLNSDGSLFVKGITQAEWLKGKEDGIYANDTTWTASKEFIKAQNIDQSKLVPLLTAALQEAVTKIEALEARVTTLEG